MRTRLLPTEADEAMTQAGVQYALSTRVTHWPPYVAGMWATMVAKAPPVARPAPDGDMLAVLTLCGNDPGHYAGPKNGRSMGRWIADAVLIALPELTGPKPPAEPLVSDKVSKATLEKFLFAVYRAEGRTDDEAVQLAAGYGTPLIPWNTDSIRYALGVVSRENVMKPKV